MRGFASRCGVAGLVCCLLVLGSAWAGLAKPAAISQRNDHESPVLGKM